MKNIVFAVLMVCSILALCAFAQKPQSNTGAPSVASASSTSSSAKPAPERITPNAEEQLEVVRLSARLRDLEAQIQRSPLVTEQRDINAQLNFMLESMKAKLPPAAKGKEGKISGDGKSGVVFEQIDLPAPAGPPPEAPKQPAAEPPKKP